MKSLLVDALRQLEDDKAPADGDKAPPTGAASESGDLMLSLEIPESPSTPLDADEPAGAPDPLSIDDEATELTLAPDEPRLSLKPPGDDVHPLASTMSFDVEEADRDAELTAPSSDTGHGTHIEAAPMTADTPRLQRLALFTPLLCLLLGSVSAGSYFAYTMIGAVNLNNDLGMLPQHVSDRIDVDAPSMESALFSLRPPSSTPPGPRAPIQAASQAGTASATVVAASMIAEPNVSIAATSRTPEDLAYPLLEDAYLAWQSGDAEAAEALYREALAVAPRHPNALLGLGAVLRGKGRIDESIPVYEALLSMDPDNATAAAALVGDDSGIQEIKSLVERHPESAPLYSALGSALAGESQWADARLAFESAWQRAPERADYAFNLAVSLDRVGQYAAAESMYVEALSLAGTRETVDRDVVVARLNELSTLKAGAR